MKLGISRRKFGTSRQIMVVALVLATLLSACASDGTDTTSTSTSGASSTTEGEPGGSTPVQGEPILLGAQLDLTGGASFAGIGGRYGMEMAIAEINENGGIDGRPIEAVIVDSETNPDGGALAVQRLIQDEVDAILQVAASSSSLSGLPFVKTEGIPYLSGAASDPRVLDPFSEWIFMGAPLPVAGQVDAQGAFIEEYLDATSVGILYSSSQAYAQSLQELSQEDLAERGIDVVAVEGFVDEDTDFTVQIRAFEDANPDVILNLGHPTPVGRFLVQARRAGLEMPMVGDSAQGDVQLIDVAGDAAEGYFTFWSGSEQFITDETDPMGAFLSAFATRFPDAPEDYPNQQTLWAYADTYVLAQAMRQASEAGEVTREGIAEALQGIADFIPGPTSGWDFAIEVGLPRTFSETDHQGSHTLATLTVEDGQFVPLD